MNSMGCFFTRFPCEHNRSGDDSSRVWLLGGDNLTRHIFVNVVILIALAQRLSISPSGKELKLSMVYILIRFAQPNITYLYSSVPKIGEN